MFAAQTPILCTRKICCNPSQSFLNYPGIHLICFLPSQFQPIFFPEFFLEKASKCRGCCIITFCNGGQGTGKPGPAAILYLAALRIYNNFKKTHKGRVDVTLVHFGHFFLNPPKQHGQCWLVDPKNLHFLVTFERICLGKLIKSTKSTAVMLHMLFPFFDSFHDFHLPILPFRHTWHPIFNGVLFTPTKPKPIQCPSHRDGDRQGDTLHSSLFLTAMSDEWCHGDGVTQKKSLDKEKNIILSSWRRVVVLNLHQFSRNILVKGVLP